MLFTRFLQVWLLALSSLPMMVVEAAAVVRRDSSSSGLLNVTIDDQHGDISNGLLPTYSPASAWVQGVQCNSCKVQPDPASAFDGTWHDATHYIGSETLMINISFTGVAIYAYFIIPNRVGFAVPTLANMTFFLDDVREDRFVHIPRPNGDFMYNFLVYNMTNLENATHTLSIQDGENRTTSLMLFDYAVYTKLQPACLALPLASSQCGGFSGPPPAAPPPNVSSSTFPSTSSSTSPSTSTSSSSPTPSVAPLPASSSLNVSALVTGLVVGSIGLLALSIILWVLRQPIYNRLQSLRHRKRKFHWLDDDPSPPPQERIVADMVESNVRSSSLATFMGSTVAADPFSPRQTMSHIRLSVAPRLSVIERVPQEPVVSPPEAQNPFADPVEKLDLGDISSNLHIFSPLDEMIFQGSLTIEALQREEANGFTIVGGDMDVSLGRNGGSSVTIGGSTAAGPSVSNYSTSSFGAS